MRPRRFLAGALAGALALAGAACSDDGDDDDGDAAPATTAPEARPAPEDLEAELASAIEEAPDCDWLDASQCLFPFPSSRFEADDAATETGRSLAIPAGAMPVNAAGNAVDPEPFARNDGWGVGTPIMVSIPGVDPEASRFASEADLAASLDDASGTMLVDLTTGERLAHWAEVDDRPDVADADRTTVLLRPATMLPEGHRIGVAIRRPVDAGGEPIPVAPGFAVYRDALTTGIDAVEARRPAMEDLFDGLAAAGVERDDLWLAWDFQVMSTENLTGELVAMRDDAFAALGDAAPAYAITEVRTTDDDGGALPEGVARWVRGTYEVPSFLEGDGAPGTELVRGDDGRPQITGTYTAEFTCAVTERQLAGAADARPVVYGHGLLGSYHETERGDLGAAAADLMLCGTYWVGMSNPDIGYAVETLRDINGFPSVADRLRQGIVNVLFLARLIGHPEGLAADPALQAADGTSSVDTAEVFYEGHSQGGIMGFAATAVSTEWTKAVIGVPGVDYSLLIPRSSNWATYGPVIAEGYPGAVEGLIVLALLQQQWDRGEGSGYVRYLTGGLPGTPDHQVIVQVALGDHQVANTAADVAARTAGIPVRVPVAGDDRLPWAQPPFGIDTVEPGEDAESLMVYWDAGSLPPPLGSRSPDTTDEWAAACAADDTTAVCVDPHEFPRRTPEAQEQRNRFFATGVVVDVCGEGPCLTEPRGRR